MQLLGRFLQIVGLVAPLVAMLLQLTTDFSVGRMLIMLLFAAACFWIGRILEGYASQ